MSAQSDEHVDCLLLSNDAHLLASLWGGSGEGPGASTEITHAARVRVVHARTHDEAIAAIAALDERSESPFGFVIADVATLAAPDEARRLAETLRASEFHRSCPLVLLTAEDDDAKPAYPRQQADANADPIGVGAFSRTLSPARLRQVLTPFVERAEFERELARTASLSEAYEHENSRLRAKLEESLRFNDTFVAVVSHDLRNPLNAVLMAIQMLQMASLADNERRFVDTARTSGRRMAAMLDDLSDLARVRLESRISVQREPSDLSVCTRRAVAELRAAHPERRVEIECTGTGVGEWDAGRIEQLVTNLVGNALRHGDPEGTVHIWLDGTDRSRVRLRVHNRGHVAPEVVPSLFDAFQSGRRRRTRSGGLGLGLYLSRQIALAHGGDVSVASSPETGTTVDVDLARTVAVDALSESEHAPRWH